MIWQGLVLTKERKRLGNFTTGLICNQNCLIYV
ncbi:hypothetical protein Goklo_007785 [Gossypium klotzschianum]|uniref:Uncharacterized protein n=1 Tax=Gossypium klotzschianum TaxID=34286 RepID=A0A7J8UXM9_9ROSI|nr:hypothetical protein [Gossypium klotzschianum]